MFRYILTLIVSAVASLTLSPYYLAVAPSVDAMVGKIIFFVVFWGILLLLFQKKKE